MATSVDAKLLRATKFPVEFNQKVDMQKVNLEVMKKYAQKVDIIEVELTPVADGLLAESQRFLVMMMMLSLNSALISSKACVMYAKCFSNLPLNYADLCNSPISRSYKFSSPGSSIKIHLVSAKSYGNFV